jgi:catechol 2,3-dioxygenase-like lactoylglutathione lyase family enzyme
MCGFKRRALMAALLLYAVATIHAQTSDAHAVFHHVHMNVVDPAASVAFYTKMFDATRHGPVAGWDGIVSDSLHVLFNKVPRRAPTALETAIWHIGWGSDDLPAFVEKGQANGIVFERTGPVVARLNALDGNPIEINTEYLHLTPHPKAFSHVHMFSAAPYCAADWYQTMLGAASIEGADRDKVLGRAEAKEDVTRPPDCHVPRGASRPGAAIGQPNALLKLGGTILFIYPQQESEYLEKQWGGRRPTTTSLVSTRGHVIDHVAISYPDVEKELARLKGMNVRVLEDIHNFGDTTLKAAMIEGPDAIAIELVERR